MTYSRNRAASDKDNWGTPQWLFDLLNDEFHFDVDVCADESNFKCPVYYTEEMNGLEQRWLGNCFCNPPYGATVTPLWVKKAFESALCGDATVVLLVASSTDNGWWWNYVRRGEVRFLPGRLKFEVNRVSGGGANFPSAVAVFRAGNIQARTLYWDVHNPAKKRKEKKTA